MKTEISRDSHQPKKRYSGVYQQQGRMLTDADWNELVDILKEKIKDSLQDVVGNGSPLHRNVINNDDPSNPYIQWGYVYIEGMQGFIRPDAEATLQPVFEFDHQEDFPSAPDLPSNCVIYADIWERSVTHLLDERLRDKGLHGADTATRKQVMAQVKYCPIGIDPETDDKNPSRGNAELTLTLQDTVAHDDTCDPCAAKIDVESSIGNYLFRLEVHDVKGPANNPDEIIFKWSDENGAEQFEAMPTKAEMPAGFIADKYVYELFDNTSEKHLGVHLLNPLDTWTPSRLNLRELSTSYDIAPLPNSSDTTYIRRWDGYCHLDMSDPDILVGGRDKKIELSKGYASDAPGYVDVGDNLVIVLESLKIELTLKDKSFVAGDYWIVDIREAEDQANAKILENESPHGIEHYYLKLGVYNLNVFQSNLESDRKYSFPPLTEITRMFRVRGNGQEAMPGQELPQPLVVGVVNGEWPVEGAMVAFNLESGNGNISSPDGISFAPNGILVKTNEFGLAVCEWELGALNSGEQRVVARLVDPNSDIPTTVSFLSHPSIYFNANLSTADQVAYDSNCEPTNPDTVHYLLANDTPVALEHLNADYYTVKEVLDALLCNLRAKHIPFDTECEASSTTISPSVNSLLNDDSGINWPDFLGDGNTTVSDVINGLLCQLEAKHIPYNPLNEDRWIDVNEDYDDEDTTVSSDMIPRTVQEALDSLVDNLQSEDVKYRIPVCDYPVPDVAPLRDYIQSLLDTYVEPGEDGSYRIKELWDTLLCYLDSSTLPYNFNLFSERWAEINKEVAGDPPKPQTIQQSVDYIITNLDASTLYLDQDDEGLCTELQGIDTVQEALKALCEKPSGGGCSVTVGDKGEYKTIQEAVEKVVGQYLNICLLPGTHVVDTVLDISKFRTVRISGSGSYVSIIEMQRNMSVDALYINLRDVGVNIVDNAKASNIGHSQLTLGVAICAKLEVMNCRFSRIFEGDEGAVFPLVNISAMSVVWQNNDIYATRFIPAVRDSIAPADVGTIGSIAGVYQDLEVAFNRGPVDPGILDEAFEAALQKTSEDIQALSATDIQSWIDSKPDSVDTLPDTSQPRLRLLAQPSLEPALETALVGMETITLAASISREPLLAVKSPKEAVNSVYDMLGNVSSLAVADIKDVLRELVKSSYEDDVAIALAEDSEHLQISYNNISGIVWLNSRQSYEIKVPVTGADLHASNSEYINSNNGDCIIHANRISRIVTKIPESSISDNTIVEPIPAYESITITSNTFAGSNNTICSSEITMSGNRFLWSKPMEVVGLVIAYSGTFTANQGGNLVNQQDSLMRNVGIQRLLKNKWQSVNRMLFLDHPEVLKPDKFWDNGQDVPAGTVMAFGAARPPDGWLPCNGIQSTSEQMPALYSAIQTNFGDGNGAPGSFNLPDLRGEFIRGYDQGRGVDSGRPFGSSQQDQFQQHQHNYTDSYASSTTSVSTLFSSASVRSGMSTITKSSASPNGRNGAETRPRNVALMYCIKY